MENTSPDAEIILIKEDSKQANIAISAVTDLKDGQATDPSWTLADMELTNIGYFNRVLPERGLHLVPKLPLRWNKIETKDYPVTLTNRKVAPMTTYSRGESEGKVMAKDSGCAYTADCRARQLLTGYAWKHL